MSNNNKDKKDDKDNGNNKDKKSESILVWNSAVNLSNSTANKDFLRYGSIISTPVGENSTKILVPKSGILSDFKVQLLTSNGSGNAFPGTNSHRNFVVRVNGVDTALKVIISGNETRAECHNDIHIKEFDQISLCHNVTGQNPNNAIALASAIIAENN